MGNFINCRSCRDGYQSRQEAVPGFHFYASFEDAASPPPIEARDDDSDGGGNIMAIMRRDSPRHDVRPPCASHRRRRRIFAGGDAHGADPFNAPEGLPRRPSSNRHARTRRRSLRGEECRERDLRDSPSVPAVVSFQTVSFSEDEDHDGDGVSVCTIDRELLADERDVEPTPEDLSALRRMVKEFWARPLASDLSSPVCVPVSSCGDGADHEVCDSTVCVPIEEERSPSRHGAAAERAGGDMDPVHGRFVPRGRAVVTPTGDDFAGLRLPFEGYRRSRFQVWEDDFADMKLPLRGYRRRRSLESCAVVTHAGDGLYAGDGLSDSRDDLINSRPPLARRSHSHNNAVATPLCDLQFCCSDLSDPQLRLEGYRLRHSGDSPDDVADFPCGTEARAEVQAMHEGMYLFHRQGELERERRKSEGYPRPRRPTAEMILSIPPLP